MWKQKLYHYVLRKTLSPYLTATSRDQLDKSLVSLSVREGYLELTHFELNHEYLTDILTPLLSSTGTGTGNTSTTTTTNVIVRSATVKHLIVDLSLQYSSSSSSSHQDTTCTCTSSKNTKHDSNTSNINSTYWINNNIFTTATATTPSMKLVARVIMDGISIEMDLIQSEQKSTTTTSAATTATTKLSSLQSSSIKNAKQNSTKESGNASSSSSSSSGGGGGGPMSRFIQTALESLRLDLDVKNIMISISSSSSSSSVSPNMTTNGVMESNHVKLSFHISSISYRDLFKAKTPHDQNPKNQSLTHSTSIQSSASPSSSSSESSETIIKTVLEKQISIQSLEIYFHHTLPKNNNSHSKSIHTTTRTKIVSLDGEKEGIIIYLHASSVQHKNGRYGLKHDCRIDLNTMTLTCFLDEGILVSVLYMIHSIQTGTISSSTTNTASSVSSCDKCDDFNLPNNNDSPSGKDSKTTTPLLFQHDDYDYDDDDDDGDDNDNEELGLLSNILQNESGLCFYPPITSSSPPQPSNENQKVDTSASTTVPNSQKNVYNSSIMNLDGFFDTNDPSVSCYRKSFLKASRTGELHDNADSDDITSSSTSVTFNLKESSLSIAFDTQDDKCFSSSSSSSECCMKKEYCIISVVECNFVSYSSDQYSEFSLNIGDMAIEDRVDDTVSNKCKGGSYCSDILRFLGEAAVNDGTSIHPAYSVSCFFSKRKQQNGTNAIDVSLNLEPIEIIIRYNVLRNITNLMRTMSGLYPKNDVIETKNSETISNIQLKCQKLTLSVELLEYCDDDQIIIDETFFQRYGYVVECDSEFRIPKITFDVGTLTATYMNTPFNAKGLGQLHQDRIEMIETLVRVTFEKAIVGVVAPLCSYQSVESIDDINKLLRLDFLSLESETKIDPDALAKFEYSVTNLDCASSAQKKKIAKHHFPTIIPLSIVKASQQKDQQPVDNRQEEPKKCIRAPDPQNAMLRDAGNCASNVSFYIPSVVLDISSTEKNILLKVLALSMPLYKKLNQDEGRNNDQNMVDTLTAFSFNCNQITLSLHGDDSFSKDDIFSHIFVFDDMRSHILFTSGNIKNVRLLFQDVTLYEVKYSQVANDMTTNRNQSETNIFNQCNDLRRRRVDHSRFQDYAAITFRSKLSVPLSPNTPAVLLDIIVSRDEHDQNEYERAVYVTFYDMTYRYVIDSCWIDRLSNFFKVEDDSQVNTHNSMHIDENLDQSLSVTNLFITVSDMNIDYTSPIEFDRASRSIIRFSEIRVSSNILSPPAPVQTFDISVADVAVYLVNIRGDHHQENLRLSCSKLFTSPKCGRPPIRTGKMFLAPSFEDALLNMNFISVLNVDCFDAVLILSKKENSQPSCNIKEMPNTSLSLDMGIVSIYTCSDSFACLLDSFGEWFIKVTAPSAADIEIIRQQYMMSQEENAKDEKISNEGQFFSESLSSVIDDDLFSDVVSINDSTIKESTSVTFEQQPNTLAHPNDEIESRIFDSSLIINDFYVPNSPGIESNDHHSQSISFEDESWTTVDHQWSKDPSIPDGEEQSARWYTIEDEHGSLFDSDEKYRPRLGLPPSSINIVVGHTNRELRVFPRHIPLILKSDDHRNNDSTVVSKLYGLKVSPLVRLRIIIENLSLKWRCFGGNDWDFPNNQSNQVSFSVRNDDADVEKVALMDELLGPPDNGASNIFDIDDENEQNISSQCKPQHKRQPRQQRRFFQFSFNGLKIRKDFFSDEALVSYMDVSVMDFAIWENISGTKPLKMIGEWLDEVEHPRDSNDGLLMMKMLSMNPLNMFSSDGNLMSEEARATMDILPLRCFIHQSALQFMREFFTSQEQRNSSMDKDSNSDKITEKKSTQPENFFQKFKVRPVKLKVDYRSKGVDTNALKDGSYVELINLLPIEQMVLTMNAVEMRNLTGWGSIISELVCNWLEHIVTTQMYKFITQTSPVHPISQIVGEMKNMVVIPLAEYKDSGNVSRSIRKGGLRLLKTCATETLNIGSKSLRFASKSLRFPNQIDSSHSACNQHYQERPIVRSINQASVPAFRSLSTGLKDANTKIVMIPYREYRKTGTMGAVQSVMKTLPVAIFQPLAGATEALSYGLEGAMNQLRPDLRREKEASEWLEDDF